MNPYPAPATVKVDQSSSQSSKKTVSQTQNNPSLNSKEKSPAGMKRRDEKVISKKQDKKSHAKA